MTMEWFFSYGLSTDPEQMRAEVGTWHCDEKSQLPDHAYMFTGDHPEFGGGGSSTIVPLLGAEVLGLAYQIDQDQLETLIAKGHGYELRRHRIRLPREEVDAVTLEPPEIAEPQPPSDSYLERVRFGLCQHYDAEIVARYLDRAVARSKTATEVPRKAAGPETYKREFGVAFRRLFPWDVTKSAAFGSGWAVLQPGEATTPHSHDEEESFIILSGEGRMTLDGRDFPVAKADAIYIEPFTAHTVKNEGSEPLEVLCVWWGEAVPAAA
jgi:mannose-6-phosphate isomerase-like protein (cupin superfamily)